MRYYAGGTLARRVRPRTTVNTPASWRVAALTLLVAPCAAGYLGSKSVSARAAIALAVGAPLAFLLPLVRASRRKRLDPPAPSAASPRSVTVVIAARNEAGVIPNLVRDLAAQDLTAVCPDAGFEVIVIDDGSTDGTGDLVTATAREAGIADRLRVLRRPEHDGGFKSDALSSVRPDDCLGEVLVFLDADARIGPAFVRRVLDWAAGGAGAMTARRRTLSRPGLLAAFQHDEAAADCAMSLGRWAAGGYGDFRGNGTIVRRDVLQAVGGWPQALTEDLDLSTHLGVTMGLPIVWARDALVWEEPVMGWRALWRQRQRWAEGATRRSLAYFWPVIRSGAISSRGRADFLLYAGQTVLPGLMFGATLGALPARVPALAIAVGSGFVAFQAGLAWEGIRFEARDQERVDDAPRHLPRLVRAFRGGLASLVWLVAIPNALLRTAFRSAPLTFDKTEHASSQWAEGD